MEEELEKARKKKKFTKDQEAEVVRRVHAAVSSVSDDLTKRNIVASKRNWEGYQRKR